MHAILTEKKERFKYFWINLSKWWQYLWIVFNFGSLENENEKLYISSIISNNIKEENLKKATKLIISEFHQFLREIFDISFVSLRELARFKKIYDFPLNIIKIRINVLIKKRMINQKNWILI
jgi:hypothetical protein